MIDRTPLYLKSSVQIEPLVDRWYAWPHIIPPATAARNITERHIKIMESYISAPQVHAAAVRNPQMLGGPFVDYDRVRVDEIRALRDATKQRRVCLIQLSTALGELDTLLRENATGFSLQPLYERVPEVLKGYVELVYDLNNHPSFRIAEPLLYRSEYYQRSAQSLMLSVTQGDSRPFALSTPRLDNDGSLHLEIPFDDEIATKLYRLPTDPLLKGAVSEMLQVDDEKLLMSLLTENAPAPYKPYEGRGARWRYFGHACILIETTSISILLDPVISYEYPSSQPRYDYADLPPKIDYVLITHNHQDHILLETLLRLKNRVRNIIVPRSGGSLQDPSMKLLLDKIGFANVAELGELEVIPIESGSITGVPFWGEHADLDIRAKLAYFIRVGRHTLFFGADSCNIEPKLYQHIRAALGPADAVFLGMECDGAPLSWLYGPLLTQKVNRRVDESRRLAGCDFAQAIDIVERLACKELYVYAMGQEPWLNHVMSIKYTSESRPLVESNRLIEECINRGIRAERLFGEREMFLDE